jgi:hypothetical protein
MMKRNRRFKKNTNTKRKLRRTENQIQQTQQKIRNLAYYKERRQRGYR